LYISFFNRSYFIQDICNDFTWNYFEKHTYLVGFEPGISELYTVSCIMCYITSLIDKCVIYCLFKFQRHRWIPMKELSDTWKWFSKKFFFKEFIKNLWKVKSREKIPFLLEILLIEFPNFSEIQRLSHTWK